MVEGLSFLYEGGKRVAQVREGDHIHFNAAYRNGTVDPQWYLVAVIAYPHRHLFPALEDGAFDEQGFELDGAELPVPGIHFLFTNVTDVDVVHLVIEEHGKGYLISGFVFVKVDVTGVIDGADHILDAVRHLKSAVGAGGGACFAVEAYVIVNLVTAFADVADEADGQHGGGIDITFVFIAHFKDPVVCAEGFALSYYVICIPAAISFQLAVECSFPGADEYAAEVIEYFEGKGLTGFEARIGDATKIILCEGTSGRGQHDQ